MDNSYHVYILVSQTSGKFYVGYTNDLDRRLAEHNRKKGKYTDAGQPWGLVYTSNLENQGNSLRN